MNIEISKEELSFIVKVITKASIKDTENQEKYKEVLLKLMKEL